MTKIEWVKNPDGSQGEVWNPVSGCTPVTEGCKNCYAKRMHHRFNKEPFSKVVCHPERLDIPLKWKKPRMVFVNSMSDLFHKDVPFEFCFDVFRIMASCRRHTFVILAKRPENMVVFCEKCVLSEMIPNLWLGVSVSTQEDADKFIPLLLETPAAKHIISVEPMLEEIHFNKYYLKNDLTRWYNGDKLSWVICGAESGPKRRLCKYDWVVNLKNQCVDAGVPFFYKQGVDDSGDWVKMPKLGGRVWDQIPERIK